MRLRYTFTILIALFAQMGVFGQEKAIGSLAEKSYDELKIAFEKNKNNSTLSKLYLREYSNRAKSIQDTLEIINAYYLHSEVKGNSRNTNRKYMDSIIVLTKNIKNHYYPAKAYLRKGAHFYYEEKYNEALENFLIARKYAKENNNVEQQITIRHNIGILKNSLGKSLEAIKIFKQNLKFIKSLKNNRKEYEKTHINTIFGLSDGYNRLGILDSARLYINKGLSKSFNHSEKYHYPDFLLSSSINSHLSGNYSIALDSLKKASELLKVKPQNVNNSICDLYISKTLFKLNRNDKAIIYLKKIDAFINEKNYIPETREAFELLIQHYEKQENVKMQLSTLKKLIKFDSLTLIKSSKLNGNIIKKFDTQNLISEKERLIKALKKESISSKKLIIGLVTVSLIILAIMFYVLFKNKTYKRRFDELIKQQNPIEEKNIPIKKITNSIDLPEELISIILEGLTNFENKKGFLDPNIKMNTVATIIQTNGNYLSKVINGYKKKNFTNYINDLRIDFCVEKLTSDATFRKYSIKAIAEEVGFTNTETFTKAFFKKNGITVSYFMKKIEQ